MSCDLKIGIGGIVPHYTAGFGGGAKIMIPGGASIKRLLANHQRVGGRSVPTENHNLGQLHLSFCFGSVEQNAFRLDMEDAAQMAELDKIVNVVMNLKRDPDGGDLVLISLNASCQVCHYLSGPSVVLMVGHSEGRKSCRPRPDESSSIVHMSRGQTGDGMVRKKPLYG